MSLYDLHNLSGYLIVASEAPGGSTLVAEIVTTIVCFLIVFWILKTFAFGPLLSVIDERRDKIASDLKKAEDLRLQSEANQRDLEERLRNIENESRAKMAEMINEGKRIASSIQETARHEADAMVEKAKQNIQLETEKARQELKNDVVNLTLQATERLIHERLDDEKHRQLIGQFMTDLERN